MKALHSAFCFCDNTSEAFKSYISYSHHQNTTNLVSDEQYIDHFEEVYVAAAMHHEFLWHKKEMERRSIQDARVESLKVFTA
jgi:hypothetical protein